MTKRFKNAVITASLFSALLLAAAAPFLLIFYQNRAVVGKTATVIVAPAALDDDDFYNETREYSLWERIVLSNSAVKLYSVTEADADGTLKKLYEQLRRLYEFGAIPYLSDGTEPTSLKVTKQTYLRDARGSGDLPREQAITVLEICAVYDSHTICACIDTDTGAVCDIAVESRAGRLVYPSDIEGDSFLNYLESFSPIPDGTGKTFLTGGCRSDMAFRLYVASVDDKTGKTTNYIFGDYAVDVNEGRLYLPK